MTDGCTIVGDGSLDSPARSHHDQVGTGAVDIGHWERDSIAPVTLKTECALSRSGGCLVGIHGYRLRLGGAAEMHIVSTGVATQSLLVQDARRRSHGREMHAIWWK